MNTRNAQSANTHVCAVSDLRVATATSRSIAWRQSTATSQGSVQSTAS